MYSLAQKFPLLTYKPETVLRLSDVYNGGSYTCNTCGFSANGNMNKVGLIKWWYKCHHIK